MRLGGEGWRKSAGEGWATGANLRLNRSHCGITERWNCGRETRYSHTKKTVSYLKRRPVNGGTFGALGTRVGSRALLLFVLSLRGVLSRKKKRGGKIPPPDPPQHINKEPNKKGAKNAAKL